MVVSKKNNDADPPSAKKAKLAPAEADQTKISSADEAAAAAAAAVAAAGGLSKETLLKGKVEESAVGKKVAAATAADIEALLAEGAKTAADLPEDKPLQNGQKGLLVQWDKDNEYYRAEILERRWMKNDSQWIYYVHYSDFNRRLDQWVTPERVLLKVPGQIQFICVCEFGDSAWRSWQRTRPLAGGRCDDHGGHGRKGAEDCADRGRVP